MEKLKIGVFMGGKSIESEVCFNSGRTICDHLDSGLYDIKPIFQRKNGDLFLLPWRFLYRGKISDFDHRLEAEAQKIKWDQLKSHVDFIFISMHGKYGEDGTLQGFLEVLGIPYLGSKVFASALGIDKVIQEKILESNNILTPRSLVLEVDMIKSEHLNKYLYENCFEFPMVVKPAEEGSSFGVSIVNNFEELLNSVLRASRINNFKYQRVLVQKKISGKEFSCVLVEDSKSNGFIPLSVTEIEPEKNIGFYDYDQKYMPGRSMKYTPARFLSDDIKKIQDICISVAKIFNFETFARIDGFLTEDSNIIIIDSNPVPGMTPSSFTFKQAAEHGLSHSALINLIIKNELAKYNLFFNSNLEQSLNKFSGFMNKKLKVGVLLGGRSNERETSLDSGRNVVYKLSKDKYDVTPLFLDEDLKIFKITDLQLVRNNTKEIKLDLKDSQNIFWSDLKSEFDFIFIALHGGEGENGSIQGTLEMLEIPYNGSSVLTSSMCMDKYKTVNYLKSCGFSVPESFLISKLEWQQNSEKVLDMISSLGLPVIIKPHDDGCSFFVQLARSKNQIIEFIDKIFLSNKNFVMIEEYIKGMELTVGVLGNKNPQALIPSQAISSNGVLSLEEKFLPGAGENQTPALLEKNDLQFVQDVIAKSYKVLGCKGYARIDCFFQNSSQSKSGKRELIILEVNTLPGLTPATCIFHQAAEMGIKPMEFIDSIVELGLEEHSKDIDF